MTQKEATQLSKNFFPIKTETLIDNTSSHFDVYASPSPIGNKDTENKNLLLYAKAPYVWTLRELTDLTRVGVELLYIDEEHRNKYDRYIKVNAETPKIDPNLEPKFRMNGIQDLGAHLLEKCFIGELSPKIVDELKNVASEVVNCLLEDPTSVRSIRSLADHDLYTYIHSVGVATLTTAIAITLGEKNQDALKEYALGGLMHDLGKKAIPLAVLNKAGPLTEEEWQIMKSHPAIGFNDLQPFGLSKRVMEIVALHHEKLDGSGYPNNLTKDSIPDHVQVATVADIYNALTTTRCYHAKRTRFEALMFMKHQMGGKLSPSVFRALVSALNEDSDLKAS